MPMTMIWIAEDKLRLDTLVTSEARHASHDAVILPCLMILRFKGKSLGSGNGIKEMMMGRWFQRKTNSGRDCEVEEEALTREEQ
ncbi:hypothetical protein HanXRQr2_Chr13g0594631 [Helianthus annuus]|uniref:Uncharacterized protein n=1 Tax=Helianthus annuus TaxID=4232 RepID=A0A9K3DR26_HELAN|nr:hypothetical protein HanXRQr2_Chr16g0733491 [Helianthus annuus]KAF5773951.1 hypothetical protein HanXRQr2_Chr13g0594631 [Helianthus annuus]KAJ0437086.1 hypothetical protein HanHA300_Chr16g0598051 [Helianthus annuus]KAJ0459397.1 hypothetical protein HanHA89_Chr16g0648511 [Helianthus annuus]KAJ0481828.1 hypothetical protein HanIR_Chr13g0647091 [Helianthus annuus]